MNDSAQFLNVATELAKQASQEILALVKNPSIQRKKADNTLVTTADLRANDLIVNGLARHFPDHAILSEETGLSGNPSPEWTWIVDPLDGTKAYAKGIPGFCVMIGLLKEGLPYLGVVVDPLEGHVYQAIRGQGAFHSLHGKKQKLQVSQRNQFSEMPLILSIDFPKEMLGKIRLELTGPLLAPINSVGIKVGLLVREKGDIYVNHHPSSYWDTCAPQVICEEAGGIFTLWNGKELNYEMKAPYCFSEASLASNGILHSQISEILTHLK